MTIKTPSNVLELMENLLEVFRNRLVFDEAFYTEDNIAKITAAQKVRIIRHQNRPVLEARAFGFWAIADNLESYGGGLSVEITLETRSDGKRVAVVDSGITRDQPLLHYLTVEKLIGHLWRPIGFDPWRFHKGRIHREPTDPYGNAEREYSHQDNGIEEKGIFRFNSAGHLNNLFLRSEEQ